MSDKDDVQVITATSEATEDTPSIGTEDFVKALVVEFNSKNIWRKLESLAEALHVDPTQLKTWLDTTPGFMSKPGKDDGVFYFCLEDRHNSELKKQEEAKRKKAEDKHEKKHQKPPIREEDRYAQAMLHMTYGNLWRILKTYGLEISQRDSEAFNFFAVALDKLESGLVLFSTKTGASIDKLPKFK